MTGLVAPFGEPSDDLARRAAAERLQRAKLAAERERADREAERVRSWKRRRVAERLDAWPSSDIPARPQGGTPVAFGRAGWAWSGYVVQCSACGRWRAWLPNRLAPAFCPACADKPSRRRTTGDPFDHVPQMSGLHNRKR